MDAAALWDWAQEYRPYLKEVASRILRNRCPGKVDASDIVEEALTAVLQNLPQFRGDTLAEWQAYVTKAVHYKALKKLRDLRREKRDFTREEPLACGNGDMIPLAASAPSPSSEVSRREQAARVLAAMDRLQPEYRQALLLFMEGCGHAQVAQIMNLSEDASKKLRERALKKLREEMGEGP